MAKKTRTELSTSAINTNLPDNTQELITPTTERAQLTDERESVVNYKDDLGGLSNAGKFLTVAVDGESLTMVDAPTGDVTGTGVQYQVAVWDGTNSLTGNAAFQFLTGAQNSIKLIRGTGSGNILFYAADGTTLHGYIENQVSGNGLTIGQQDGSTSAVIDLDDSTITFKTDNSTALTISSGGETFWGSSPKQAYVYVDTTNDIALIGSLGSGMDLGFITGTGTNKLTITSGGEIQVGENAALVWGTNGATDPYIQAASSGDELYFGRANGWQMAIKSDNVVDFKTGIRFINGGNTTLDAYEEGTWTPNVGGNATYSIQGGNYTRIGNIVYVSARMKILVIGTGNTGNFVGLPYNSSILENSFAVSKLADSSLNFYSIYLRTGGSDTVYASYQSGLDGTIVENPNFLTSGTEVQFSGCYIIS